jgi:Tol biopolymer transport system component
MIMNRQQTSGLFASGFTLATLLLAALPALSATQIVSQLPPAAVVSTVGGGSSYDPIVTPDGRYVLFASTSDNLVANAGGLPMPQPFPAPVNVFVRDRQTGATVLVSVNAAGTAGGNGNSFPNALSTNGQFVVFESAASDLIAGDTNAASDVFVRDVVNNTTTLVSVSTNGAVGNGDSRAAAITADGRYVAFVSAADNLVAGDQNGIPDVFVRDLQLGVTALASPGAQNFTGTTATPLTAGSSSEGPVFSDDGRYVAFYSSAVGLVTNATNSGELYIRDLVAGSTIWASTNAHFINSNAVPANYVMSTNGQFIAYQTTGGTPAGLVFRYNVATGACDAIATNGAFVASLDGEARAIDMSGDGQFVAFTLSNSSGGASIQLWNAQSGATSLISGPTPSALCGFPRVDRTGRYVAFTSDDASLTTNSDGGWHIYLRDASSNTLQLVDVGTTGPTPISYVTTPFHLSAGGSALAFYCQDGALSMNPYKLDAFLHDFSAKATEIISAPAPALPSVTPLNPSGLTRSSVSSNGQYVAFSSSADGIVSTDTNGCQDVFVHDLVSGANTLVSVSADGPYSGNGNSSEPAISADGRYVAFSSYATNLVANDTNNASDVFVRDLQTGSTALVSVAAGGTGVGNGNSCTPQLSADGQRLLFFSQANNLTTNSVSANAGPNLFWRDLQAGLTYAVTTDGSSPPVVGAMTPDGSNVLFGVAGVFPSKSHLFLWNAQSHLAVTVATLSSSAGYVDISADAQRAAFTTAGSTAGLDDIYALDLVAQTNVVLATMASTSHPHSQFSGDGRFLAYAAKENGSLNQIYLYDFETGTNTLVSPSYDPASSVNAACDSPAISAAGRFVAYRSAATNLVPVDTHGFTDIFLYDRLTGGTTLISVSEFGPSAASGPSLRPVFSADGQTVFFESWASDLAAGDFNESSDVFALSPPATGLAGSTNGATALKFTGIAWETASGQFSANAPLMLSWSSTPGVGYQVQFKNNLTDPEWQPLNTPPTVVGNQGQIMDLSPDAGSRFYRIVSF